MQKLQPVFQSDAAAICAMAQEHGALTIVDAVTSLGGTPVLTDEWGADAVYSGVAKMSVLYARYFAIDDQRKGGRCCA